MRRSATGCPRDAGTRLASAIVAHGLAAGCAVALLSIDQQDWASATFVGQRQRMVFTIVPDPTRAAWLAALPDAGFAIPRHLLADLAVALAPTGGDTSQVVIETLLLQEG